MAKVNEFLEEPEKAGEPALPADVIKKFNQVGVTSSRSPRRVVSPARQNDTDNPAKRVKKAYRMSGSTLSMRQWAEANRHDPTVQQWLGNKARA